MIVGKKNPYVFTIGFDKKNPEHLEVVEILNGTEKKAALIAEAILQYMGKKAGGNTVTSQEGIQEMIRIIVRQEMERNSGQVFPLSNEKEHISQTVEDPDECIVADLNEDTSPIDERTVKDIADAMAAFRNM